MPESTTKYAILSKQEIEHYLFLMHLSVLFDKKTAILGRQNKGVAFHISTAGHEAIGVAFSQVLKRGVDWFLPYYRDAAVVIGLGSDLPELFGSFLARNTKNHCGGISMPSHFSHKDYRIVCRSSMVGTQWLQAVGVAKAIQIAGKQEVVYVSGGEGSTSQGDFHEALNFSAIHKLPVVFVVQDNGWAISVPREEQTAGGSVAGISSGYQGLSVFEVDGTDIFSLTEVATKVVERARTGLGPSVVVAKVSRLGSHSNSDDQLKYRSPEQIHEDSLRDPISILENIMLENGFATAERLEEIKHKAKELIDKSALEGEDLPLPEKGSEKNHIYSPDVICEEDESIAVSEEINIRDAINHGLDEAMTEDDRIVVFGEDVAGGKGGVFGVTRQLTDKHGKNRCFNTPLAEATIFGLAIGAAATGYVVPVAEIQFADYVWHGAEQIIGEASTFSYRAKGEWTIPFVSRIPTGGYIQGGNYHSQSIETFFAHCPGLKIAFPSNSRDAKGLLKTALKDQGPVLFFEHKGLYARKTFCSRLEPSSSFMIPFGKAKFVKQGTDVTIVCWGMMVVMAADVAKDLETEGISVEIIDLRTLIPWDKEAVLNSVKKTGKVLVAHEAPLRCGFGAEIVSTIVENVFEYLDAPIKRIGALETAVPYSLILEEEVLPKKEHIKEVLRNLAKY